jgi:hypothetical protein
MSAIFFALRVVRLFSLALFLPPQKYYLLCFFHYFAYIYIYIYILLIVSAAAASGSEEKDEKWLSLENIAS